MSDHYFKRLLSVFALAIVLGASALAASFPYIRLNGHTNRVSDSGTVLTYNGIPVGASATQISLSQAGTITLDFTAVQSEADLTSMTGAVTFTTSNLAAAHSYTIFGRNTQATNCAATWPSWQWMGGAPASITAQKAWTVTLYSRGTVDTNVFAAYAELP